LVDAAKKPEPVGVLDLFGLDSIRGVNGAPDGDIVIGAGTTYRELLADTTVVERLPMLAACAREVGALQIQARGTLGGNIATSSPVGDTLPVLLALDATIELASADGVRTVPYREFCTGYRQTALGERDLIVSVRIPTPPLGAVQYWRKVGPRRAQSISKVMLAGVALVREGVLEDVRLGLGAVAATPVRATKTEKVLLGQELSADLIAVAKRSLADEISPIDDVRSTARYRLRAAQYLVGQMLRRLG